MRLSDELESAIATTRARVRLRLPFWLRPFLAGDVVGITLGRRVYMAAETMRSDLEALLWHELAHVAQLNRLGVIRFYWRYLSEYLEHRRAGMPPSDAYRNISFERQAVLAERARAMLDV